MNLQFSQDECERHCENLCSICRNLIDEFEQTRDCNLPFRVGILSALAYDFSKSSNKTKKEFNALCKLIDKVFYGT